MLAARLQRPARLQPCTALHGKQAWKPQSASPSRFALLIFERPAPCPDRRRLHPCGFWPPVAGGRHDPPSTSRMRTCSDSAALGGFPLGLPSEREQGRLRVTDTGGPRRLAGSVLLNRFEPPCLLACIGDRAWPSRSGIKPRWYRLRFLSRSWHLTRFYDRSRLHDKLAAPPDCLRCV